eukprot:COSAG02_NODE_49871_length_324_cov_0.688889_1_plen_62_part_01
MPGVISVDHAFPLSSLSQPDTLDASGDGLPPIFPPPRLPHRPAHDEQVAPVGGLFDRGVRYS